MDCYILKIFYFLILHMIGLQFVVIELLKWNRKSGDILYCWISLAQKSSLSIDFLKKPTLITFMKDSISIIPKPPCCIALYTMFIVVFKFPCTKEPISFLRFCNWVSLKGSTGAKKMICERRYVFAILIRPTTESLNFAQINDIPLIFTISLLKLVSTRWKVSLMSNPKSVRFITIAKPVSAMFSAKLGDTFMGKTWVFLHLLLSQIIYQNHQE